MQMTRSRGWGSRAGSCTLLFASLLCAGPEAGAQGSGRDGLRLPGGPGPAARPAVGAQVAAKRGDPEAPARPAASLVARARNRDLTDPRPAPGVPAPAESEAVEDGPAAAAPAESAAPAAGQPGLAVSGEGKVALNFDNADVNAVIASIAELIGLKYVVEPGVQGAVTLRTAGGVLKEDLLPVLHLILEVNGLTAVQEGDFYRITPSQDASRLPIPLRLGTDGGPAASRKEVVTQIIPLRYLSVGEMSKLAEPFLAPGATMVSHEGSNTLLVVDTGANVAKVLKLAEAFDTSLLENMSYRFFFLKNADPQDAVKLLKEVFAPANGRAEELRLVPIDRLYAFLAIAPDERMFAKIEQLLLSLDADTESTEPRLHVYFVRNGTAQNLADLLGQVFADAVTTNGGGGPAAAASAGASRNDRRGLVNPLLRSAAGRDAAPGAGPAKESGEKRPEEAGKDAVLGSSIRITPDEIRNALILEATAADHRVIMSVLESIDVPPRQVLIEATIAEIDYSIVSELGLNWQYLKGADFATGVLSVTSGGAAGLTAAVGFTNELRATLSALEQENKANIINSPRVLASDNQEARIDVSQEIPVVSAESVVPSGGESIVTTTVQYRDTGVLLSVTPHINDRKLVSMDIYQEVSEQADSVVVAGALYPSFFKRVVDTTLTVEHGQTIVLGGLIRENSSKGTSGVPCLARIPLFGPVFGQKRNSLDKTELIILLTPTVIVNRDEIDAVTEEFRSRVKSVVESMEKARTVPFSPLLDDVMNPSN